MGRRLTVIFRVEVPVWQDDGQSIEDAIQQKLDDLAGSNDGAELIANMLLNDGDFDVEVNS